jgi:phage shock protein PspC (stress-responsive transcriptional regulator)
MSLYVDVKLWATNKLISIMTGLISVFGLALLLYIILPNVLGNKTKSTQIDKNSNVN